MTQFFSKMRDVALLLTFVPFIAVVIALDRRLRLPWGWLLELSLPRTMEDLLARPEQILDCMKRAGSAPPNAVFVSFNAGGGSETEPGKDKSTVKGIIKFRFVDSVQGQSNGTSLVSRSVFIKIPTGRGVSAFFRAIAATFVPVQKEIAFYQRIVPALKRTIVASPLPLTSSSQQQLAVVVNDAGVESSMPLNVPLCLYAGRNRWLDRTLLIFEEIDTRELVPIPDWKGVTTNQLFSQLQNASVLHALSWNICNAVPLTPNKPSTSSATASVSPLAEAISFIKDRNGIKWLVGVMDLVQHKLTPAERSIWNALIQVFSTSLYKDVPMCLSHADCRPGNMLYRKGSETAAAPLKSNCVVTDWEAVAVTPYLWDCAYAMVLGLDTKKRRSEQRDIVASYLKLLSDQQQSQPVAGGTAVRQIPSVDEAMSLLPWVYLLVQYYAWILDQIGGVGDEQGNSSNDMKVWRQRVREMLRLDVFGATEKDEDDHGTVLRHDAPVVAALLKMPGVTAQHFIEYQRKVLKELE
ncbi:membrane-associated protein, putative [Bodo saltans]|uniref:Membrane-associated protein, putative n=1 Tax=Bodo saltans TaxID=75058 RepID=A0A0S4KJ43_BODSA|nr:membrane-associated protein, putative [Bodo saltans]|eukprot:CUI14600.1 membrane-associated protein, putative [Bodo saltans]